MADERILKLIHAIVEAENNNKIPNIPQWFYDDLDKRHDRHLKEESKSFSWDEVKERILNQ